MGRTRGAGLVQLDVQRAKRMMARHEKGICYVQGSSRVFLPMRSRRMHFAVILAFNEGSKERTPKGTSDPRRRLLLQTFSRWLLPSIYKAFQAHSLLVLGFRLRSLRQDLRPVAVRMMWARCGSESSQYTIQET